MVPAKGQRKFIKPVFFVPLVNGKLGADFVPIAAEEIVVAQGKVEETPRLDALRIVIVVLGIGPRYFYQRGSELRRRARVWQSLSDGGAYTIAREPGLELLIGSQVRTGDGVDQFHGRRAVRQCG